MLVDAARKWRGEFMSTLTITSFVMPDEINKVFEGLKYWTLKLTELRSEKQAVQIQRTASEALMASNPEFKWGKNETEREAQVRNYAPDVCNKADEIERLLQDAINQVALLKVELERIQTLIDLFKTTSLEV
jgi:hypothetical protein